MVADESTGAGDPAGQAQIDELRRALENGDVLRSINIIDSIGNRKNILAIDALTALHDHPGGLIRSHAEQALGKLKAAAAGDIPVKPRGDPPATSKDNAPAVPVKTDDRVVTVPVNKAVETIGNEMPGVALPVAGPSKEKKVPKKRSLATLALAGTAVVLVIVMIIALGAFAIIVLLPPVWTEQLDYKNSTGQFQDITIYRNATDRSYGDVTSFIAEKETTLEAAIAADAEERPVEYAVWLHDNAEMSGLNCSLVATGIENGYPGHVFLAFRTTDNGMRYVDPTARNVSAADYPGIDFGNLTLLRDTWVQYAGFLDGDNRKVYMTVYRDAAPVDYATLLAFLAGDRTEDAAYIDPAYTCANFASDLLNRSGAEGIKCGLVTVAFEGQEIGHAFNAFPTTDKGIILIDDTGLSPVQKNTSLSGFQTDAAVYLQKGKVLGELNLTQVEGQHDYAFYEEKLKMINDFYAQLDQYDTDVDAHNRAIDQYDAEALQYAAVVSEYNAQMSAHNSAVDKFNTEEDAKYKAYLRGDITYQQYTDWFNANVGNIPAAPGNKAQLENWKSELDSKRATLNGEMRALNQRYDTIWNSEGRKWAVYSYWQPPDGVVNKIEYVW